MTRRMTLNRRLSIPANACILLGTMLLVCLTLTACVAKTAAVGSSSPQESPPGKWVYLRQGALPTGEEPLVEVIAVGDVMPGRGLAGTSGIFDRVALELQGADLVLGNLEGVMVSNPSSPFTSTLSIPPQAAETLAQAGFDVLGLANNHALDAGPTGLAETAAQLRDAGITPLLSAQPVYLKIQNQTFALLAWSEIPGGARDTLFEALASARSKADVVILLVHWGGEYRRHPALPQRELAEQLVKAGVDVLLGAHPHVVQDLAIIPPDEAQKPARLVAYSLGNFAFDQGWDDTAEGLALRLLFDPQGLRAVQAIPLRTVPRPAWLDPADAEDLFARILPAIRLGFVCSSSSCGPVEVPQQQASGMFWSGAIDLTGDGRPEIIQRQEQAVEIFEQGESVWRSPPQWQVQDLAAGDPNHDGRYELLLALQKTGTPGTVTSHPFVLGFRGGTYRVLWGGSAVESPLLEVELVDLDGDGLQELAVLETSPENGERYLTLWRWHGWGFSLLWRSDPGSYHDLIALPSTTTLSQRLSVAIDPLPQP